MDLGLICTFIAFIFSVYFSIYHLPSIIDRRKCTTGSLATPPGSTGLPFIGETLQYLSAGRKGVHEKFITDRTEKYSSKVFKTSLMGETMVLLCGAEGNKFLFSNENKLVRFWVPRSLELLFRHPEDEHSGDKSWEIRKILSSFLKANGLKKYIETMDLVAKQHLHTHWNEKEVVEVYLLAQDFIFTLACRLFLGIQDPKRVARLKKPFGQMSEGAVSLPFNIPGTRFSRAIKASKEVFKEIDDIVKQCKAHVLEKRASGDMQAQPSNLLQDICEDGNLASESDVANVIAGFIFAGYESTASALSSIVMCLAEMPDVYEKVLTEQMEILKSKGPGELVNWEDIRKMKYSWNVACEVLRLYPPGPGNFREAKTDFIYGGFLIPKGWKLHYNVYATHKNPEYFQDPDKFDPSRFQESSLPPFCFVPFGGGPRMCPGSEYVRLKILVFMHNVVTKFKWKKVYPEEKIVSNPLLRPSKGLPIYLSPRN